jgi:hypothetical protein
MQVSHFFSFGGCTHDDAEIFGTNGFDQ